jgi:hypothetical protein
MALDERNFPDETIEELFTYHAPTEGQRHRYEDLRHAAKLFAKCIVQLCPPSADCTDAIRKLRECVMAANASIALEKVRE